MNLSNLWNGRQYLATTAKPDCNMETGSTFGWARGKSNQSETQFIHHQLFCHVLESKQLRIIILIFILAFV